MESSKDLDHARTWGVWQQGMGTPGRGLEAHTAELREQSEKLHQNIQHQVVLAMGVCTARMFMKHPEAEDAGCLQRLQGEKDGENVLGRKTPIPTPTSGKKQGPPVNVET